MGGKFITFEGCDGSGKTTQAKLAGDALSRLGVSVILTREPGGTKISEKVRKIILDENNKEMVWRTEALLYAASRSQLVGEVINPALEEGINVICDRYIDSTLAYQGFGRGLSLTDLKNINVFAADYLKPDLTILLDLDPEETLQRRSGRKADRLEKEQLDFHQRVREGYLKLAEDEPQRFVTVSGSGSIDHVHNHIMSIVLPFVKDKS
ncbi:MAG: dTMP kinase [Bacillota bacterium]